MSQVTGDSRMSQFCAVCDEKTYATIQDAKDVRQECKDLDIAANQCSIFARNLQEVTSACHSRKTDITKALYIVRLREKELLKLRLSKGNNNSFIHVTLLDDTVYVCFNSKRRFRKFTI